MSYCSITNYLESSSNKSYNEMYSILKRLCIDGMRPKTLIVPSDAILGDVMKLLKAKTNDRSIKQKNFQEALKIIKAYLINSYIADQARSNNSYDTNNSLNHKVKISAGTKGEYEITSGKDMKTTAKVVLDDEFVPSLTREGNNEIPICVAVLKSGTISHDGLLFSSNQKMTGASEYTSKAYLNKVTIFCQLCNTYRKTLDLNDNSNIFSQQCGGLLKFLLMECKNMPEYEEIAKKISPYVCYDGFATWYILISPYAKDQILPNRLFDEWGFAPYIGNYCEIVDAFCNAYPSGLDDSVKKEFVDNIKESDGIAMLLTLGETYEKYCGEILKGDHFVRKMWADELCHYICKCMCSIRESHNSSKFNELCDYLKEHYPGNDYSSESMINNPESGKAKDFIKAKDGLHHFLKTFCFMKCQASDGDELGEKCKSLTEKEPSKPSRYTRNFILLNSPAS